MYTPSSTCSIESGLDEVRPDPPVLLGRVDGVVVDPPASGRLEQRMVEEEAEPPAGAQDPGDLGDRGVDGVDVLEHEAGHRRVERPVGERQLGGARCGRSAAPPPRSWATRIWFHVGSTPTTSAPTAAHQPADLAVAAPDVEDPVESIELRRRPAAGSAPRTPGRRRRVNPSIHQSACASHRS